MAQTSELLTLITADNSQFREKIAESAAAAKEFGNTLTESFEKAKGLLAGGIIGGEVIAQLKEGYESIDNMVASANKLGISTDGFQLLEYAAKRTNVEMGSLETSIAKMRLSLSREGSDKPLAALGLDRDSLNKMGTEQAFEEVISKLKTLDSAAQIDIGTKLFGRGFQQILNIVNGNMKEFNDNFKALGGAVPVDGFEDADKKIKDLDQSLLQLQRTMFLTFGAPAIAGLSAFTNFIHESSNGLGNMMTKLDNHIQGAYDPNAVRQNAPRPTDPLLAGIANATFGGQKQNQDKFHTDSLSEQASVSGVSQASASMFKLVDASSAVSGAFHAAAAKFAEVDLKKFLGLDGQSGKEYLSSILKPVEQVKDKDFTDIANEIRNNVQMGIPNNSVSTQSDLAQLKAIANSYNGGEAGTSNSGMQNAVQELTKLVNATIVKPQTVTVELKYDQNGIIKAFASSSGAMKVVGNAVESLFAQGATGAGK